MSTHVQSQQAQADVWCRDCGRELPDEGSQCPNCDEICPICGDDLPKQEDFVEGFPKESQVCADCRSSYRASRIKVETPEGPADPRVTAFHDGGVKRDMDAGKLQKEKVIDRIIEGISEDVKLNGRQFTTGQKMEFCDGCHEMLPMSGNCDFCD